MVNKIKAAVDTRVDGDLILIARTDARAVLGIDEAIERAHVYVDAGADVIFVEAPQTEDEIRRIGREISVPKVANMVEGVKRPCAQPGSWKRWVFRSPFLPTASCVPR